jgi:hypothetical protein
VVHLAQTQKLQGIVDLGVEAPHWIEDHGKLGEVHKVWFLLEPGFKMGLKIVAMGAVVPEELHHIELARFCAGIVGIDLEITLILFEFSLQDRERRTKDQEEQKGSFQHNGGSSTKIKRLEWMLSGFQEFYPETKKAAKAASL